MSIDSLYNSNPSLKLKILQDVVDEYKSYVAGAAIENSFGIFGDAEIQNTLKQIEKRGGSLINLKDEDDIKKIQKAIVSKFLFSSNGCYQIKDLLGNELVFDNLPKNVSLDDTIASKYSIGDAIAVLFEDEIEYAHMSNIAIQDFDALWSGDYLHAENFKNFQEVAEEKGLSTYQDDQQSVKDDAKEKKGSMKKMLKSLKFTDKILDKREFETLLETNKKAAERIYLNYLNGKNAENKIAQARNNISNDASSQQKNISIEEFKNKVLPIYTSETINQITSVKSDFINNQSKGAILDPKPTSPAMSAIVIKDQSMGITSRNDNFLSIFLGAVSPLELSRCTPYLSLTFFNETPGTGPDGYREYLDNVAYMKFAGGKDGVFSKGSTDPLGLGSAIPQYAKTENKANRVGPVGNMDIFTSPQTMVNANINSPNSNSKKSLNAQQIDNVLDPFAPMLSLGNMSITVPGGQYFLVTNRRAKLSVTLHDRSRLEEISPFVSLNQLGRTIVRIEHGWSHPDGDIISSKNTIGKFLNSMRETGYYSLTSSDFSFSGNSVKINLTLDFFGATDFVDNHICFGEKKPMDSPSIQNALSRMFDDILENNEFKIKQLTPEEKSSLTTEQKTESRKNASSIKKVIKAIKILRTHAQNSTIAVDTELANDMQQFIEDNTTGLDRKFVNDGVIKEFLNKFFELLGIKKVFSLPDDASISDIKSKLSENGFSKAVNENLRLNYAKETMEKVNSLIGKRYIIGYKEKQKKKSIDLAPDPIEAKKADEKKSTLTTTETETIITETDLSDRNDFETGDFLATNLTPDYFLTKKCFKKGVNPSAAGLQLLREKSKDYTSLGKLICAFVGLPAIAGSSNYSELQVFFYPINNQAAGARKYTTASLPVNNIDLLKHIQKSIKNNYNLTLKNFFEILSNMFESDDLDVYEIGTTSRIKNVDKLVKEKLEADKKAGHEIAFKRYKELLGREILSNKDRKKAFDMYKDYLYKTFNENRASSLNNDLKNIYEDDKLGPAPLDKFTKPILQMEIEAIPIIAIEKVSKSILDVVSSDKKISGKDDSKRVLRLHIYDSNSSSKPFEKVAMESSVEFDKFIPVGGAQSIKFDLTTAAAPSTVSEAEKRLALTKNLRKLENDAVTYFKSLSPRELKQYLIRSFPTIRYGSQIAVVKQISVSSNTSNNIVEARLKNEMKKAYDKKIANIQKGNDLKEDFSAFIIPTSVDITLYGCPFITVGAQIFLDLGTGTDIDNIYMVTAINHSIGKGEYSTTITVQMPAQGTVKSTKDKLVDLIKLIPDPK